LRIILFLEDARVGAAPPVFDMQLIVAWSGDG